MLTLWLFFSESSVSIIDEDGNTLRDIVGPIDEGSKLSLLCESNGGQYIQF